MALLVAVAAAAGGESAVFATEPAAPLFNRDVRPILSRTCFACHGPDANARQAELRLDDRAAAVERGAFIPGDAAASALVARIFATDPETIMPPPASHKTLSEDEKSILRRWIAAGAEYQAHWSLVPLPTQTVVPTAAKEASWVRNPIDAFILSALEDRGWTHAAEAPREAWLRRATLDLTGLPPTLAELDAFLADAAPDAYERAVDRLLASPAFGERMASDWLDVARYADTFGYQADRQMHVWPWRDWVVRAFNDNLPYDQFITWQTAGDLLTNATHDQRLATAFNRLHRQTNEGGSIEEEFRAAYVSDRVTTNGTAFLGLTFECARCHEHKFDPISQADFYRLAAFFASIDEHGLYSHFTETAPTPALFLYDGDQEAQHQRLLAAIRDQETQREQIRQAARERFVAAPAVTLERPVPAAHFSFDDLQAAGDYGPAPGKSGQAVRFGGDDPLVLKGAGAFDRTNPFTFALWVQPAQHRPREIVLHRSVAAEDSAYRGYALVLDNGVVAFSLIHFWPGNALRVQTREAIPVGQWTHLAITYDGSSRAAGLQLYVNGQQTACDVIRDRLTLDMIHRGDVGDSGTPELSLGARFRDVGFRDGLLDELSVFDRELVSREVALLAGQTPPEDEAARLAEFLALRDEPYQNATRALQALRKEENELSAHVRRIMVMEELPEPRPMYVLRRGAYDSPGEQVSPDVPASILPFPDGAPRNRLGLAQWMTDPRHPLVGRVAVNRFWQIFFGRGLVVTASDFGSQGQPPSHPELLDWLARRFIDSGWNVKDFCRLIILSATYRQSSIPADGRIYQEDPENVWCAHGPRHRWSAEQIRDQALAVSGLLVTNRGGPPVFPYQPAGLWEESGTHQTYTQSHGEGVYRRSLYTFWRRTSPPPSMTAFDAPSREFCTARRERTGTPLQALVLFNDPQFIEAARVLAQRLLQEFPTDRPAAVAQAFRQLTSRQPSAAEQAILADLLADQLARFSARPDDALALLAVGESPRDEQLPAADHAALTIVVQTLMNFDECVTKR